MTDPARVGLSLLSVVAAVFLLGLAFEVADLQHFLWKHVYSFGLAASVFALPGWLLWLPFLLGRGPRRRSIGTQILAGILVGPLFLLLLDAVYVLKSWKNPGGVDLRLTLLFSPIGVLAVTASTVAAGIYLAGYKWLTRKTALP